MLPLYIKAIIFHGTFNLFVVLIFVNSHIFETFVVSDILFDHQIINIYLSLPSLVADLSPVILGIFRLICSEFL